VSEVVGSKAVFGEFSTAGKRNPLRMKLVLFGQEPASSAPWPFHPSHNLLRTRRHLPMR
jgi:hypothetical protein